ncbi:MAG: glycerate kinase, partial [Ignavibacteriota bacterium]
MHKKILVAPNSFKECADSVEISEIISKSLSIKSDFRIIQKPLSDGGDGFLSVIKNIFNTSELNIQVKDELDHPKTYKLLIDETAETGYLESASIIGLKCFEGNDRKPLILNSAVLGKVIKQISIDVQQTKYKIKNLIIGIGGTATIDFGIGACTQLGLKLLDGKGNELNLIPKNLNQVENLKMDKIETPFNIKCIVDVDTELIGEPGAIEIYGKQKGATQKDLRIIKDGIENILNIITIDKKYALPKKINGAGGGLAAGLNIFLDADIIRAEDFIKSTILKDLNLNDIDAVVTGEGSFDLQSFEGKGAGIVLKLFSKKNIPIFLINGSTNLSSSIKMPNNVQII